jgi:uncharacterized membrane protein
MRSGNRLQLISVILVLLAYAALSHYSSSNPQHHDLGAALAIAPLLGIGWALFWRWAGALPTALAAVTAAILLHHYWPLFTRNFSLLDLIQQCGFYAIMVFSFGRSLRSGHVPLCTQLADKIQGPLNAEERRYTRRVTAAWVMFFFLNWVATLALFLFAPLRVWSLFVNVCSLPLILLMFMSEYAVRRWALPDRKRSGLMATLRVYFANPP